MFAVSAFFITAMFLVAMTGLDLALEDGQGFQTPEGRVRRCNLNAAPLSAAFGWIVQYRLFWEDALDALANYVEGDDTR